MSVKKTILLLTFLFVCLPVVGQHGIQEAEKRVAAFMQQTKAPGLSVSVSKEGELIWSKGFGYADLENRVPVNPSNSKFRIGSVSKTLTAAGMGLLIQQEKLDPDKEVQHYVSYFPRKRYPITVKQVAGHLAGIRHYRGSEFMSDKKYETIREGITIFEEDTLLFTPGTQYRYSSYGWNLISAVIEEASGEPFLSFMENRVFEPLGMQNTEAEWAGRDIPNRVRFYVWQNGRNAEAPYVDNSYKWAGGGFIGTTEDLIRFGEAHFEYAFLDEQTQHVLMQPQQTEDGESTNYGMGWMTMTDNEGRTWLGHSGGSVGGTTMFIINKQHQMVVALTVNRSNINFENLHFDIAHIFLN